MRIRDEGKGRQPIGERGMMAGRIRHWGVFLLAFVAAVLAGREAEAQLLPIKVLPSDAVCGSFGLSPAPVLPEGEARGRTVDALISAGSQAAILGEYDLARTYLQEASALDPMNAVVAYRLARILDDQGAGDEAAVEYCRYLTLGPPEPDAVVVLDRVRALAAEGSAMGDPWATSMEEGIDAYVTGRYRDAIQSFSRAIELREERPEPYFNRALSYEMDGRPGIAVNDYETYLALSPTAEDAAIVQGEVGRLRLLAGFPAQAAPPRAGVSPAAALAQGLFIPGLGQQATGRPALGALVLAAAGGAVYLGFREVVVVRREQAQDPFGNEYEYDVRSLERPHVTKGIGAAAVIAVAGAIESFVYAGRRNAAVTEIQYPLPLAWKTTDCAVAEVIRSPLDRYPVGPADACPSPPAAGSLLCRDGGLRAPPLLERPCPASHTSAARR